MFFLSDHPRSWEAQWITELVRRSDGGNGLLKNTEKTIRRIAEGLHELYFASLFSVILSVCLSGFITVVGCDLNNAKQDL